MPTRQLAHPPSPSPVLQAIGTQASLGSGRRWSLRRRRLRALRRQRRPRLEGGRSRGRRGLLPASQVALALGGSVLVALACQGVGCGAGPHKRRASGQVGLGAGGQGRSVHRLRCGSRRRGCRLVLHGRWRWQHRQRGLVALLLILHRGLWLSSRQRVVQHCRPQQHPRRSHAVLPAGLAVV